LVDGWSMATPQALGQSGFTRIDSPAKGNEIGWFGALAQRKKTIRGGSGGRLGRHLPQHCPVGTVEAPIRDLLPVAAGGIVYGVIEPPVASLPRSYHQGEPLPC